MMDTTMTSTKARVDAALSQFEAHLLAGMTTVVAELPRITGAPGSWLPARKPRTMAEA